MTKKLKHPTVSLRNPATCPLKLFERRRKPFFWRRRKLCFTSVALLAAWLGAPETRAGSWTNLSSGLEMGAAGVLGLAFSPNGDLYAGGQFTITNASGGAATNVAKWDGSAWTSLSNSLNDRIWPVACDTNGNLYAAGDFTNTEGIAANRIAKWHATTGWTNLGTGMSNTVRSLVCGTNDTLYAGGDFTNAGGGAANFIAKWNGTTWSNLSSGVDGPVWALALDTNGNLYAGGSFTTAGGVSANYIAKWNGSSWSSLGSGMGSSVHALIFDHGNLYAGGYFTTAGGVSANHIAKWDGSAWSSLGNGIIGDVINALACNPKGYLYAGGYFTTAGNRAASNIAKWDGSSWTNLGTGMAAAEGMNSTVQSLACDIYGNLYAGGFFTTADGVAVNHIAKWTEGWIGIVPPATLRYTATNAVGNPAAQTFVLTNAGPIDLNFTNKASYSSGANDWFRPAPTTGVISANGGTQPVTGNVDITGMVPGWYYATNIITATNADNGPQTLVATLQVLNGTEGRLGIAPATLTYFVTNGVANLTNQTFIVKNTGPTAFNFTNTASYSAGASGWFTTAPLTGNVLPDGGSMPVIGSVNITGLGEGVYYATNTIRAVDDFTGEDAENSPQTLVVTLHVLNGRISIVPTNLTYEADYGGANPDPQSFVVTNAGSAAFNFTNTVSWSAGASNWFTPSPTTGVVSANGGSLTVTGSVINITNLNVGTYYATNTFTAPEATNSPQTLVVTLHVWPVALGIAPATLTYMASYGGANPAAQTFVVTNKGQTPVNFFTNTVTYSSDLSTSNWFRPSPTTGRVEVAGWLTMTGTVDITSLTVGVYYATNTFTATNTTPQKMVVTLYVFNPAKQLSVSTPNEMVVTEGQGPVYDIIQVANTGTAPRGVMSYALTTTSSNDWLSVNPTDGDVTDITNNVVVKYDATAAGLRADWYTGQVYAAVVGDLGDQSVNIRLRVNHRPGVAWNAGSKIWTNEVKAGGSLGSATVEVWNASGTPAGQMRYTVSVLDDPYAWVSVSPTNGVSTGYQQVATNLVIYTTAGLAVGDYTAKLKVTGVDNATGIATTNEPLIMGLQLTVKGTPVLKTDVTSLSQTVLENHTYGSSFLVWNEGRVPRGGMRYAVTVDAAAAGWVRVSLPTTGVVTNNTNSVMLVWGTTTLPPEVYTGNLTVTAVDAQYFEISAEGSPLKIPLKLTVTPRKPSNMELPTVVGTMYIGQTVEANVGLWQNQARLTNNFCYQWEWASNKTIDDGNDLSGATNYNYVITNADWMHGKYLRVNVTATDPEPFPMNSTAYSAWVDAAKVKALRTDFNGDGITDLWFYDEPSGTWHASFGTTDSAEGIFGGTGMMAVPGDYDGDGYEDIGVYERAHGMWYICYLPRGDYVYGSLFGGTVEEAEATPMVADYDGDGATDVAFYWMGYWAILYSSLGSVSVVEPFADIWGEPVSGDWDGNGIVEMGVYADGLWTLRMGNGSVVEQEFGGGGSGVLPAPADYDGDGATDLGVYDVGANQWRWRESRSGFEQSVRFGLGGKEARPGYYDHDRSNDWAQVHLSADNDVIVWEVKRTTEPTNYPDLYHGQSFQQSTDRWRVSW